MSKQCKYSSVSKKIYIWLSFKDSKTKNRSMKAKKLCKSDTAFEVCENEVDKPLDNAGMKSFAFIADLYLLFWA